MLYKILLRIVRLRARLGDEVLDVKVGSSTDCTYQVFVQQLENQRTARTPDRFCLHSNVPGTLLRTRHVRWLLILIDPAITTVVEPASFYCTGVAPCCLYAVLQITAVVALLDVGSHYQHGNETS